MNYHIPDPLIVMLGCAAWDGLPVLTAACPVCHGGIHAGDDTTHCPRCGSSSPKVEAQCRGARIGLKARERHAAAAKRARDKLARRPAVLTECERRRLWNGYRGSILAEVGSELTNRARAGREFLVRVHQEPDFSLVLNRRGKTIGRSLL